MPAYEKNGQWYREDGSSIRAEDVPAYNAQPPETHPAWVPGTPGYTGPAAPAPVPAPRSIIDEPDRGATPGANPADIAARVEAERVEAERRKYDASFQYGGWAGGAHEAATRYADKAAKAQLREGETIDYTNADWNRQIGLQAREAQRGMAGLMEARARGQVPSIAQMQADRQMGMAAAEQSSAAASARGPAGLALAQQGAAANTAAMQSNISNQAQINAATERLQAEQAAFGAYGGMRQGDLAGQAQDAQQAIEQARIRAAQRAQNDAYDLGMTSNEIGVQKTALDASGRRVEIETGVATSAANRAESGRIADAASNDRTTGMILGAAGTGLGIGATLLAGSLFGGGKGAATGTSQGTGGVDHNTGVTQPGQHGSVDTGIGGGYDGTGAPVASGGGGYDPDSDVRVKKNIRGMTSDMSDSDWGAMAGLQRGGGEDKVSLSDLKLLAQKSPEELRAYGDHPAAMAVRGLRGEGAPDGDPATAQLADGLSPSFYDYKTGRGTPGQKFGPMANNMAENPATATAVRSQPGTGLLGIDGKDGLKVALGGVGHLAQKQQATDAQVAKLQAQASGMMGQQDAYGQGLMSTGPRVGAAQGFTPLQGQADTMLREQNLYGQGLMSRGPSVGDEYLAHVRGGL
jgi:hypothetical protein